MALCDNDNHCLAGCASVVCGLLTIVAFFYFILEHLNKANPHAIFSIQSIAVSPSSATWHVDFLVKNPISRYSIYYETDETSVRLGHLNAAVLNTSHEPKSSSHTAFSVDFVAEGNPNAVILEQLDIKLKATHKVYFEFVNSKNAVHIDIKCYNPTRSHEIIDKIQCLSSFTEMVTLSLK